jgi:hypothetical protein
MMPAPISTTSGAPGFWVWIMTGFPLGQLGDEPDELAANGGASTPGPSIT